MKKALHFSGLNGLRAIAALIVLFSHTTTELNTFGLNSFLFGKYPDGSPKSLLAGFGVSIFFALSGFLITYLLLEEKRSHEINIKNFYLRRILRIWPLYYLYFLLSIFTLFMFDMSFEKQSIFFYVFLLANVPFLLHTAIGFVGHYWSLGVEEQFYSFWPWIIKRSKSILTVTTVACLSLILLKCMVRYWDIRTNNGNVGWLYNTLHTVRFQCMLIGAIGAILYFRKQALFLRITNNVWAQSLCWFVILLVGLNKFHIASFLDNEFIATVTVVLIIGQICKTNRIVNLEFSFLNFIGKISYGIYVLHPLIIFYLSKAITFSEKSITSYLIVYFSVFLSTIIIAYLSYEYFEKPFLKLKEKYSTVRNSTTAVHAPAGEPVLSVKT